MADVVRTLKIVGQSEGLKQLAADTRDVAKATDEVAQSTARIGTVIDTTEKRQLSVASAYRRQTLALDETAKAQDRIAKQTRIADAALQQGLVTQSEHAQRLDLIRSSYERSSKAANDNAKVTKLNQYELLNLSRQIQDVGVSLAGGQSPFVVLTQQGSQIFDIFQASRAAFRDVFSNGIRSEEDTSELQSH